MHRYSEYSLIIDSELALSEPPDLPIPARCAPDVVIRRGEIPRVLLPATGEDEMVFHRAAGTFHIRNGREIIVDPTPGVDPGLLRIVLFGRITAFLLRQRGWLPLHASGVSIGGKGVLFLGISGSGKSTTAAACYSRGHDVITDDVAPVRMLESVCMALTRQRLRLEDPSRLEMSNGEPAAITEWDKYTFDLTHTRPLPPRVRIDRIYVLVDSPSIGTEPLAPVAAVRFLSMYSFFRRRRMPPEVIESHLRDCVAVAMAVPAFTLRRPRDLSQLGRVVDTVEQDVAHG